MNKYLYVFFVLILGCSLNSNSSFWTESKKIKTDQVITKLLFEDIKPNEKEFNPNLKVNLPKKIYKILIITSTTMALLMKKLLAIIFQNLDSQK